MFITFIKIISSIECKMWTIQSNWSNVTKDPWCYNCILYWHFQGCSTNIIHLLWLISTFPVLNWKYSHILQLASWRKCIFFAIYPNISCISKKSSRFSYCLMKARMESSDLWWRPLYDLGPALTDGLLYVQQRLWQNTFIMTDTDRLLSPCVKNILHTL